MLKSFLPDPAELEVEEEEEEASLLRRRPSVMGRLRPELSPMLLPLPFEAAVVMLLLVLSD